MRKDLKVQLEMMVQEEHQVPLDHQDLQDPVVRRENLDPKDHLDHQDPEEHLDQEGTLVLLVLLDFLAPLVLMANLE